MFCASVDQAEQVTEIMRSNGLIQCTRAIEKNNRTFKAGSKSYNIETLTVGFNSPICDLAALIRATDSTAICADCWDNAHIPKQKNAIGFWR